MTSPALKALLLDLDDTLLGNPMKTFIPAYFRALTDFVTEIQPPERLIEQLLIATRKMDGGDGAGPSNGEIFAGAFFAGLGVPRGELEPVFERFYAEAFPKLRPLTALRPAAPKIVEWAGQRGLQVVIATNPVFPRTAIEQYYREILAVLGLDPEECLMVGDNWNWDVVNAAEVGIPGYWIADPLAPLPSAGTMPVGQGSLDDFFDAARSRALEESLADRMSERLAG